ncbi:MAG TPA: hypothetical protein VK866_13805 [Acidimicrobiales bacterium]|nr:hypothetical protein [Acidimicrobiales bacterium]
MTGAVDRHRQRCYDAETAALGGTLVDERWPWADLVALLDRVVAHPWWIGFGVAPPHLRPGRSDSRRSWSDGTSLVLAPAGCTPLTLAHELAHHLRRPTATEAAHGPTFRAAEVRTVALVGGTTAGALLEAELHRWRIPPAPWVDPEPPSGVGLAELVRLERLRATTRAPTAGPPSERIDGAIPLGSAPPRAG